jgi:hypothetical protein
VATRRRRATAIPTGNNIMPEMEMVAMKTVITLA